MKTMIAALVGALLATVAAAQEAPLRIGFLTVRTGPLAAGGRQMEEGINLFLKERNNALAGRKVQIFFADTAGQPAQAKTKAQELVEREKVHILVGPLATFEALALDEYVLQAKVPLLPPMSAAQNDLAQRKQSDYVIHTYGTAAQAMYPLGDYAATKLGIKRMAMIADDFTYGHEGAAGFQKAFEDAGGRIVQKLWPPLNAPDYGSFIGQLKSNVDGVYAGFAGSNPLRFLRAYREYGLKPAVFGNPTLTDEGILKNMGEEALGVYTASWYAVDHDTPDNQRFVAAIRKEYNATPGFYTAATYTSGLWIEQAMKLVNGKFEDKAAFVRALHEVQLDHSPMGPLRLDEYGKPILNVYIRKVERRNGELVNLTVATYRDVSQFWKYDPKGFIAGPQYTREYPPLRFAEP
ncbi:MAG TPA: ABC transporter substrate-binding protein [Burkholderiales bacterium]|jgi:branched-chain amino acid transport system substrate-binding protein|nr:ABC transporter substrate-binding protein [Burkholderiales bacterium]